MNAPPRLTHVQRVILAAVARSRGGVVGPRELWGLLHPGAPLPATQTAGWRDHLATLRHEAAGLIAAGAAVGLVIEATADGWRTAPPRRGGVQGVRQEAAP